VCSLGCAVRMLSGGEQRPRGPCGSYRGTQARIVDSWSFLAKRSWS
jgi:hypothetical protein